jgi:O-antigen/teichoic acid export membrane protein
VSTPIENQPLEVSTKETLPEEIVSPGWLESKAEMQQTLNSQRDIESKAFVSRVLSGSFMLLAGTGSVTFINIFYTIAVARFLGPSGFGAVAAVCTLLILVSAVTLSFQLVSAKIVAQGATPGAKIASYRRFHRTAWACGMLAGALLFALQSPISAYLNLPSTRLVSLLALAAAFYVPLGSRRGYLQGSCLFRRVTINVVLEGLVKLGGSVALIYFGYGAAGVIAANAASVVMAYFFAAPQRTAASGSRPPAGVAFREGLQALVFFAGVVVINNSDILVVKHFFAGPRAGLYAAVALIGRVVYFLSFSVVSSMFPIVAETRSQNRRDHGALGTSLLLVSAIGVAVTLGLRLAPSGIWAGLFGAQFGTATDYNLPSLLALYAGMTTIYSLSVVIILYEMSHKIVSTAWVQLGFGAVLLPALYRFHASLAQVIWVQVVMVLFLLAIVAAPIVVRALVGTEFTDTKSGFEEIRRIRQVSEHEVISEFLKTDFRSPDFKNYQSLSDLVSSPDVDDARENKLRRALFFIRHGALWRELPKDTQWFEIEIRKSDLDRVYVFPRAHWRKLAGGDFSLNEVVRHIATEPSADTAQETFRSKIRNLRELVADQADLGTILLIGRDETGPLTILDGNHRVAAGMLVSSGEVQKFRYYCGLSPNMADCCWYETNFATLCRYAKNLLKSLVHNPEAEVMRLLQKS